MDKQTLRKNHLILRKTLDRQKASLKIVEKILNLPAFCAAKNVLIYYPLKHEINLLPLLEVKGKKFYLPKVMGSDLLVCPYNENLEKSKLGIMEPCDSFALSPDILDISFVPALAVDKNLNRLGYGGGFYDRFLKNKQVKSLNIAVLFKELVVDEIEVEPFDKKVDMLLTD